MRRDRRARDPEAGVHDRRLADRWRWRGRASAARSIRIGGLPRQRLPRAQERPSGRPRRASRPASCERRRAATSPSTSAPAAAASSLGALGAGRAPSSTRSPLPLSRRARWTATCAGTSPRILARDSTRASAAAAARARARAARWPASAWTAGAWTTASSIGDGRLLEDPICIATGARRGDRCRASSRACRARRSSPAPASSSCRSTRCSSWSRTRARAFRPSRPPPAASIPDLVNGGAHRPRGHRVHERHDHADGARGDAHAGTRALLDRLGLPAHRSAPRSSHAGDATSVP